MKASNIISNDRVSINGIVGNVLSIGARNHHNVSVTLAVKGKRVYTLNVNKHRNVVLIGRG